MSTISLKNHLNHADGSRSNKINANTVLCSLIAESITKPSNITLSEINFKAADKMNIIFTLPTADTNSEIQSLIQTAIQSFNDAVTSKLFKKQYDSILKHPLIITEQVDVNDSILDGLLFAKINKGNQKGDKYDAEVQFKKAPVQTTPVAAATKPTATPQAKSPETTIQSKTTTVAAPESSSPQQNQSQSIAIVRKNPNKEHSETIADTVLSAILTQKTPIDFVALTKTHQLNAELSVLEHTISLAKNKEKAQLQAKIDEIKSQLITLQPQYDELRNTIATAVLQDVVTVSNLAYTKGFNSLKKL